MNDNATHQLSLTDIDAVLPEAFEVLHPSDQHAHSPHALRVVRHVTTWQTDTFQTPRQYCTLCSRSRHAVCWLRSHRPAISSSPHSTTTMSTSIPV